MRYRTKLYLSLVSAAFFSILLAMVIFSTKTEQYLLNMVRSRALCVVATSASLIDPDIILAGQQSGSIDSPAYIRARDLLVSIVNVNRRNDVYLDNMYTLFPSPSHLGVLLFGIDSDTDITPLATTYDESDAALIYQYRNTYFSDPAFVADAWGVWLSAYAPIRDQEGKYIATLGVDINVTDIHLQMKEIFIFALWGLSSAIVFSLAIAFFLAKKVTSSLRHLCQVVATIGSGNLETKTNLNTKDEFGELGLHINQMIKGLEEKELLKTGFARYVSHHVLDKILVSKTPLHLEGERKRVTILFSDIRQFTQLAEKLEPEQVVHLLNEYFEQMIEVIFSFNGTLDKFIGDGIMAEFGAPLDDQEQEVNAIKTALAMQKALHTLCQKWTAQNRPVLQMGIGIHTGEAIVGNIGSIKRTQYTAIGDTVNVAFRLEQATKILHTPIIISETTYQGAKGKFHCKDLGTMSLPGRKEQITVYSVEGETK